MPKNIVILSDGTGQEGGVGHNTNIYKLYNMLLHRSPDQIAFYDKGIGTGTQKFLTNACGMGITRNILDCYRFLHKHYQTGDSIYLFGFSRGATTVRSLSSFIHLFGILPQARPELIKQAYKIYKIDDDNERDQKAKEFIKRHHTMWCRIRFLGVWDTVAALGVPIKWIDVIIDKIPFFKHSFQDVSLSPSVEYGCQALAIDDERKTFHPEIWKESAEDYQTIEQVWFAGMHTDVGGGYEEQGLSDIPLSWMINKAEAQDLRIYENHTVKLSPNPDGVMHNSRGNLLTRLYRKKFRAWPYETHGLPKVHQSVVDRTFNKNNEELPPYAPWILQSKYDVVD